MLATRVASSQVDRSFFSHEPVAFYRFKSLSLFALFSIKA
jgi:hypothetical protein